MSYSENGSLHVYLLLFDGGAKIVLGSCNQVKFLVVITLIDAYCRGRVGPLIALSIDSRDSTTRRGRSTLPFRVVWCTIGVNILRFIQTWVTVNGFCIAISEMATAKCEGVVYDFKIYHL